jgi:hypothetical protein
MYCILVQLDNSGPAAACCLAALLALLATFVLNATCHLLHAAAGFCTGSREVAAGTQVPAA